MKKVICIVNCEWECINAVHLSITPVYGEPYTIVEVDESQFPEVYYSFVEIPDYWDSKCFADCPDISEIEEILNQQLEIA